MKTQKTKNWAYWNGRGVWQEKNKYLIKLQKPICVCIKKQDGFQDLLSLINIFVKMYATKQKRWCWLSQTPHAGGNPNLVEGLVFFSWLGIEVGQGYEYMKCPKKRYRFCQEREREKIFKLKKCRLWISSTGGQKKPNSHFHGESQQFPMRGRGEKKQRRGGGGHIPHWRKRGGPAWY